MSKLTISLLATFAILLIAVDASIFRTTVTTTEIEDENPQSSRRCQQQIQQQDLSYCESFIQSRRRGYSMILLRGGEEENQKGREHLDQCCQQLRRIDQQCRCDALEEIVRDQQQRGQIRGQQELREIARTAEQIPNMCRMERPRSCRIQQGGQGGGWF